MIKPLLVGLGVFAVAFLVLGALLVDGLTVGIVQMVLPALSLACFASALVYFLQARPLTRRMREIAEHDPWRLGRFASVVLEGKPEELQPGEESATVAYAATMTQLLPKRLTGFVLFCVGIALLDLQFLLTRGLASVAGSIFLLAFLGVPGVVTQYRRLQRARRYVKERAG